jgi:hypothetical protein
VPRAKRFSASAPVELLPDLARVPQSGAGPVSPATHGVAARGRGRPKGALTGASSRAFLGILSDRDAQDPSIIPYLDGAKRWARAYLAGLAPMAGGIVGPGPTAIVAAAAQEFFAAQWMFDAAAADVGEIPRCSLLANASAMAGHAQRSIVSAHNLAMREAEARRSTPGVERSLAEELEAGLVEAEGVAIDSEEDQQ